ncbi:hypothetical protein WAI453_004501 [Rhynchosporium graminicola]
MLRCTTACMPVCQDVGSPTRSTVWNYFDTDAIYASRLRHLLVRGRESPYPKAQEARLHWAAMPEIWQDCDHQTIRQSDTRSLPNTIDVILLNSLSFCCVGGGDTHLPLLLAFCPTETGPASVQIADCSSRARGLICGILHTTRYLYSKERISSLEST